MEFEWDTECLNRMLNKGAQRKELRRFSRTGQKLEITIEIGRGACSKFRGSSTRRSTICVLVQYAGQSHQMTNQYHMKGPIIHLPIRDSAYREHIQNLFATNVHSKITGVGMNSHHYH